MEQKILITLGVNPNREPCIIKGYAINLKKHKGIKTGSTGMGFKNFVERIGEL